MSNAAAIARSLRGFRSGDGWLCRCPVPGHGRGRGDTRPSLRLSDGEERLLVYCFAGCNPRDVLDELRRRGLLDGTARSSAAVMIDIPPRSEPHEPDQEALAIWRAAKFLPGTLAEKYLRDHRRRSGPYPPTLRFASALLHPKARREFPALLAAVQGPDRRIVAMQATFLREPDGAKAPLSEPRWTFGRLGKGAVRLAAAGDVLGLAEGTEDALSAMAMTGVPTWSCVGGKRMHLVEIPPIVRVLHIFGDDDAPGRKAADKAAEIHAVAGREVVVRLPPPGFKDWNDFDAEERRGADAEKAVAA